MLVSELILKKRNGGQLDTEEIKWIIDGYTRGEIPDYQISAMLMAIYFQSMTQRETFDLTMAMANSGQMLDLSSISGVKADKHSTGGVGDKTSLVLLPMVTAQGVKMAKMSGRGLGHTGGTIDKLESFPGFNSDMSLEKFLKTVDEVGFAIAGQTENLTPADKKLYALRDVTGTVDSRPLIVSSIMSKKLAAGADVIVLDVKTGSGAFMHGEDEAFALAREMVETGRLAGKKTIAVVTDMDQPLGNAVGNALEVKEAIEVLRGNGGSELLELCLALGENILIAANAAADERSAKEKLVSGINDGSALRQLARMVQAQNGDPRAVYDTSLLPDAPVKLDAVARESGYIASINAQMVGKIGVHLGGGRTAKDSAIDLSVGVVLCKKAGERVAAGERLAVIHAADMESARQAAEMLCDSCVIGNQPPRLKPLIRGVVK